MGASSYTVGTLIDTVEQKLQDEGNDQWSSSDLLNLYNLTLRKISSIKPRAYTKTEALLLDSGTRQSLPTEGFELKTVVRNMGMDGATAGNGIRETSIDLLTSWLPSWTSTTETEVIQHFMRADDLPYEFYVYPPSDGTGYVEVTYYRVPPTTTYDADGAWENETVPLADPYIDAIINGILYMAYDDDSDLPGNTPRSQVYYQRFLESVQMKASVRGGSDTP